MANDEVARWSILKFAVVNADKGLVELILKPPVKMPVLPYVVNPFYKKPE